VKNKNSQRIYVLKQQIKGYLYFKEINLLKLNHTELLQRETGKEVVYYCCLSQKEFFSLKIVTMRFIFLQKNHLINFCFVFSPCTLLLHKITQLNSFIIVEDVLFFFRCFLNKIKIISLLIWIKTS